MTGEVIDEPSGLWAPLAAFTIAVTISGLAPGEAVYLDGAANYDFGTLGCGVEPSPCTPGSGTTDPSVHLCRPAYAEHDVKGTATTSAEAIADDGGRATPTLRFVVSGSQRACPAGESLPWFVESGEWSARVTDAAHGLSLVGPPDWIIGP